MQGFAEVVTEQAEMKKRTGAPGQTWLPKHLILNKGRYTNTMDNMEELQTPETEVTEASPRTAPGKNWFSGIFDYLEILIVSLCAVFLIFTFVVRMCSVSGPSMESTLHHNDKLLVSDCFYTPTRGDIVVFHQTITDESSPYYKQFNETIIKRVIGVGGDRIRINFDTAEIFVNGEKLDEPYLPGNFSYRSFHGVSEYVVPKGQLFVLGDNRNNSTDSRSGIIGFVDERRVIGRVIFRVYPDTGTVD